MRASFRPPSASAIWKTDLEWGSRKNLHVLTKHKLAVVSISFLGNEQIPEPVGMCNQEFKLKLPCVWDWGALTDIFFLNLKYPTIEFLLFGHYVFGFWLSFMVSFWFLPLLHMFSYTFWLHWVKIETKLKHLVSISLDKPIMGHSVVGIFSQIFSQLLCNKPAVWFICFYQRHSSL